MLITLKASFPRTTNTTTMTPRIFRPMPIQRLAFTCDGNQSAFEKGLIEIGEIQPVLV